jgi:hypothetical protein
VHCSLFRPGCMHPGDQSSRTQKGIVLGVGIERMSSLSFSNNHLDCCGMSSVNPQDVQPGWSVVQDARQVVSWEYEDARTRKA